MYINPFWAGVLAVIFVELAILFALSVVALVSILKRGKYDGRH